MANTKKINKSAEKVAESNRDAIHTVVDHIAGLQERNVRFAQGVVESTTRELRGQAESNRALVEELVERAENQQGVFQTLVEESVDAYMELLFAPLSYYKQSLQTVKKAA